MASYKVLDLDTCHVLVGQFNSWRIAIWHDQVELGLSGKRGNLVETRVVEQVLGWSI